MESDDARKTEGTRASIGAHEFPSALPYAGNWKGNSSMHEFPS